MCRMKDMIYDFLQKNLTGGEQKCRSDAPQYIARRVLGKIRIDLLRSRTRTPHAVLNTLLRPYLKVYNTHKRTLICLKKKWNEDIEDVIAMTSATDAGQESAILLDQKRRSHTQSPSIR